MEKLKLYDAVEVTLAGFFFGIKGTIIKIFEDTESIYANDKECLVDTNYPNKPHTFRCYFRYLKKIEKVNL